MLLDIANIETSICKFYFKVKKAVMNNAVDSLSYVHLFLIEFYKIHLATRKKNYLNKNYMPYHILFYLLTVYFSNDSTWYKIKNI